MADPNRTSVADLIAAIDRRGEPFTVSDLDKLFGNGSRKTKSSLASLLSYLCHRGVVVRCVKTDWRASFMPPVGKTAAQAHAEWIEQSAKNHKGPPQRRGVTPKIAAAPPFPLGEVRFPSMVPAHRHAVGGTPVSQLKEVGGGQP